jgi:glucose/arabinose dehydrogenase
MVLIIGALNFASMQQYGAAQSQETVVIKTEKVVANLGTCGVTFEFLPDGRILCGELRDVLSGQTARVARIRLIENNNLLPDPLLQLDIYADYKNPPDNTVFDERGLIGLALDPNFEENHYVYVHWTYLVDAETNQTARQIARFTLSENRLVDKMVILDGIPAAKQHVGGPLEFGPDGKLYITGGEAGEQRMAQNLESPLGKILRVNPDGTVPEDNPFAGKPFYTIGHRNSFGIAFHPLTGVPYISENGPNTNDEINMLQAGKNYGWPAVIGNTTDQSYVSPIFDSGNGTIAPTELEFYTGDKYPQEMQNDLFFLAYNPRSLERLKLQAPDYDRVEARFSYPLELAGVGSYTDIELGPDGYFYVSDFKSIYKVIFESAPVQVLEQRADSGMLVRLELAPSANQNDNSTLKFSVQVVDPATERELYGTSYNVEVLREGNVLLSEDGLTGEDSAPHEYLFERPGPADIIVGNINGTGDSVTFHVNIVPEFPSHLALVALAGLSSAVLVMNYRRIKNLL